MKLSNLKIASKLGILVAVTLLGLCISGVLAGYLMKREMVNARIDQAKSIVDALAAKHVPHAYLLFAGEQHGFRQADNIVRALEAELSFYAQVFGFAPAGDIAPVEIAFAENLT